jgi:hypothetical protein
MKDDAFSPSRVSTEYQRFGQAHYKLVNYGA